MPADGEDFPENSNVLFSVTVEDADPIVAVSWTISSPVFEDMYGGDFAICTNNHCERNLLEGDPFQPNDGPWESELGPLPGGTYEVRLEAADYHGNVAEALTYTFTVNGGMGGEGSDTDGMTTTDTPTTTSPTTTMGMTGLLDEGGEEEDTGGGEEDTGMQTDDEGGCNCTQSPGAGGAFMLILGLFGFAATRRRD
jgi:MYXO-CTERM domain-containing protein